MSARMIAKGVASRTTRSKSPLAGSKYIEPAPSSAIVVRVIAAPRSSATPRSRSQSARAMRLVTDGSFWRDRVRPGQPASGVAEPPGMEVDIADQRGPSTRARQSPERTIGRRHSATDARLYSAGYPSCILVMHSSQRCTLSSGASRIAGDRPVPHIVTELPGPKARAHVAFDETWTSPSLPRAYPIVPVRGEGLTIEDIDGNLFLDFAAGIAVNSTGHCTSAGRRGDQGAGRRADPLLGVRLLPADLSGGLPRDRADRPDRAAGPGPISATPGPRSSRHRSSWRASRPSGHTSWPSLARSMDGRMARSR